MSDTTEIVDDAGELAAFGGGFDGKAPEKPAAKEKPEPATQEAREEAEPKPEYVQITAKDWEEIKAAAARTASYEKQFSSFNGKLGNIYTTLNTLKEATPRDLEVKMPDDAFTKMAKDFPELAELSREEFKAALAGLKAAGNAKPDAETIKKAQMELEEEDLEDAIPDWKEIVGAVPDKNQADQDNPFRKWLATKPAAYQDRINGTIRAPIIQRAIRLFQNETKAPPKPAVTPRNDARAERIRGAIQPKGDSQGAPPGNSEDEAFAAGFNSR